MRAFLAGIPQPRIRLVATAGVRAGIGEVEAWVGGVWGIVRGLTDIDARVICREIGWDDGIIAAGHMFRPPTQARVVAVGGACRGSESSFLNCTDNSRTGWDLDDPTPSGMTVACSKGSGEWSVKRVRASTGYRHSSLYRLKSPPPTPLSA